MTHRTRLLWILHTPDTTVRCTTGCTHTRFHLRRAHIHTPPAVCLRCYCNGYWLRFPVPLPGSHAVHFPPYCRLPLHVPGYTTFYAYLWFVPHFYGLRYAHTFTRTRSAIRSRFTVTLPARLRLHHTFPHTVVGFPYTHLLRFTMVIYARRHLTTLLFTILHYYLTRFNPFDLRLTTPHLLLSTLDIVVGVWYVPDIVYTFPICSCCCSVWCYPICLRLRLFRIPILIVVITPPLDC